MPKFKFNKLVRDEIKAKIESRGGVVNSKILSDLEFLKELKLKLKEESDEILSTENDSELIGEIADLEEILSAIKNLLKIKTSDLEKIRQDKSKLNGNFSKRIYIEDVEVGEDDPWIGYYRKSPGKYPEV